MHNVNEVYWNRGHGVPMPATYLLVILLQARWKVESDPSGHGGSGDEGLWNDSSIELHRAIYSGSTTDSMIPKTISGARNGIQQVQVNATGLHTRRYRTVRVVRARATDLSINTSYNPEGRRTVR
jgi:hypothetical protein